MNIKYNFIYKNMDLKKDLFISKDNIKEKNNEIIDDCIAKLQDLVPQKRAIDDAFLLTVGKLAHYTSIMRASKITQLTNTEFIQKAKRYYFNVLLEAGKEIPKVKKGGLINAKIQGLNFGESVESQCRRAYEEKKKLREMAKNQEDTR